jgi:hypothetical protein
MDTHALRSGLKLIARGIDVIAEGLMDSGHEGLTDIQRDRELAREWGSRGLTKQEAADLCAKWGFPGQKISAWVRGGWAEVRGDRRYLTPKAAEWIDRADEEEGRAAS